MYSLKDKDPTDSFKWGFKECNKILKKNGISEARLFLDNRKKVWKKTKNYSDKKAYDGAKKAILRYERDTSKSLAYVQDLELKEDTPDDEVEVACVIAFKDRHKMVEANIKALLMQSIKPKIILVASSDSDVEFCEKMQKKYAGISFGIHPNNPIGGKWEYGVQLARLINPNSVLILGSDDVLSLNYIEDAYKKIKEGKGSSENGLDLVGSISWMIYNIDKELYDLSYNEKVVPIVLGGGRLYSKYFLDSCDWNLFEKEKNKHLDSYGHNKVKDFSGKIGLVSSSEFILSIKGPWEVINSAERILAAKHRIFSKNITSKKKIILSKITGIDFDDLLR